MSTARRNRLDLRLAALIAAAALAAAIAFSADPAAAADRRGEAQLSQLIHDAIRAGGPLFDAEERAAIERKCGYAPGSWDGFDANISNGVFHCSNGRRLDDAETRAMIDEVMRRPEVRAAIQRVAEEASAEALRELAEQRGR